jgi:hypothetical protein
MIFRFLLLSDEVDDFKREIKIDADATFEDLQKAIISSVGYKEGEIASFFICSDDWEKELEITAMEMDTSSDIDSYVMSRTPLGDLLEDERQKLLYIFDFMTERGFFMELREIIPGQNLDEAVCSISKGNPPAQFVDFNELDTKPKGSAYETGENFYGDEDFSIDELDSEGFDGLEAPSSGGEEDLY